MKFHRLQKLDIKRDQISKILRFESYQISSLGQIWLAKDIKFQSLHKFGQQTDQI